MCWLPIDLERSDGFNWLDTKSSILSVWVCECVSVWVCECVSVWIRRLGPCWRQWVICQWNTSNCNLSIMAGQWYTFVGCQSRGTFYCLADDAAAATAQCFLEEEEKRKLDAFRSSLVHPKYPNSRRLTTRDDVAVADWPPNAFRSSFVRQFKSPAIPQISNFPPISNAGWRGRRWLAPGRIPLVTCSAI